MFRFLNKIFGSIAAFILYPLKSLLISLALILGTITAGIASLIVLPIIFAIVAAENAPFGKFMNGLGAWLGVSLIMLVVAPVVTTFFVISEAYSGVKDVFRSAMLGVTDGYEQGLFFHVLSRAVFDFSVFNRDLLNIGIIIQNLASQGGSPGLDSAGLAGLRVEDDVANYFDLVDVPQSPNAAPNLREQTGGRPQNVFNPLTAEQLALAEGIDELEETVANYKSLYSRLEALDRDLRTRGGREEGLRNVMDEIILMEITKPALLVKQYQDEHGKWKAIPNRTKIIDAPSMEQWLAEHNSHPETREAMDDAKPQMINDVNRSTRYRIKDYTSMADAQELVEASLAIRSKLNSANLENVQAGQLVSGLHSLISSTFFGDSVNTQRHSQNQASSDNDDVIGLRL